MYRPRLVLGFLGSLLVSGLSLIWCGSGGHRGEKPFSTLAPPCSESTIESSPCEPFPPVVALGSTASELASRLDGTFQEGWSTEEQRQRCQHGRGFPERSTSLWVSAATCRGTSGYCGTFNCWSVQGPSQCGSRPHRSAACAITCQRARSPGEAIERECQSKGRAPRRRHCLDREAGATYRCSQRQTTECSRASGQRPKRGHRRAAGGHYELGCRSWRPGQPGSGLTWPGLDDDAGGRNPPSGCCTPCVLYRWTGRQRESCWLCPTGTTVYKPFRNCVGGESRPGWPCAVSRLRRPGCAWIHVIYPGEVINVWREHGHFRSRLSGQAQMESTWEQTPPPIQEPTERARSLGRTMAESGDWPYARTSKSGRRARRRGTYSRRLHDSAHVEDIMVQDFSPMLGARFCCRGAACTIRVSGTSNTSAAPHFRPCNSHCGGRSIVDIAGSGGTATGIRLGGPSAGRAIANLAWGLPGMSRGSAPGQTGPPPLSSCDSRPPLQHRCRRTLYSTGVVVPGRIAQPRHPAHRRPVCDLGLPCPTCLVDHALSASRSTGRARPVKLRHVSQHEAALWHLHASLVFPFLSICLIAMYRVVRLCTDFWSAGCRSGIFTAVLSFGLRTFASCLWLGVCLYRFPMLPGLLAVLCELGAIGLALTPIWGCPTALRTISRLALPDVGKGCEPPGNQRCGLRSGPFPSLAHIQGCWHGWRLLLSRLARWLPGQVSGCRPVSSRGTRSCLLPRIGRIQPRAQVQRSSPRPRQTLLLLYLCCVDAHALHALSGLGHVLLTLPAANGVQLMAHGFHEGRPVFSTGSIPQTQAERDLCEVVPLGRSCNLLLSPSSRPRRQLAVFFGRPSSEPPLLPCPITMLADERLHGPALHHRIALNLGSDGVDAGVAQLQSPLPGLPAEQLLFMPRDVGWNTLILPVDLRPLGGGICLIRCERSDTCAQVLAAALEQQGRFRALQGVLGRCSLGWFSLGSQPLVLHNVDALQFAHGPEPAQVQPLFGASLEPPFTLDTLMQISASPAGPPVEVFSGFSAHHAVLFTPNGLLYVEVPVFADANTYRRLVALQASPTADGGIMRVCGSRCLPCRGFSSSKSTASVLQSRVFWTLGPQGGAL